MLPVIIILAALLVAIPSACLALLVRAEKKRDEMDKRFLKEMYGVDRDDEREG